jgi:hypothetical protein
MQREFVYYSENLPKDRTLVVDGLEDTLYNLSHWPGNLTPEKYKADTTTEMALKWAGDPQRDVWLKEVRYISNDHLDTDGVLSTWVMLNPDEALSSADLLIDAATAGDFEVFTSEQGVKLTIAIETMADLFVTPFKGELEGMSEAEKYHYLYKKIHSLLPDLMHNIETHDSLWRPRWDEIQSARESIVTGQTEVRKFPEVTVFLSDRFLPNYALLEPCDTELYLTLIHSFGGVEAVLQYQPKLWFELVSQKRPAFVDLKPLAARLSQLETGLSGWHVADRFLPQLYAGETGGITGVSALDPDVIIDEVRTYLG